MRSSSDSAIRPGKFAPAVVPPMKVCTSRFGPACRSRARGSGTSITTPATTRRRPARQPRRATATDVTFQDGVHRVGPEEGDRVLEVWEASVRATHHFLADSDIEYFRPLVLPELFALEH